ncbi:uncharacterized protein STEHIDRAFT_48181, partial [Stereum hirsutum FP-91666 SS1]|uniref:uncharacterized protein n=1 Tax=Stereum hirsutum (strain FP-91666) TaxID=721885 RepID=UPI000440AAC4
MNVDAESSSSVHVKPADDFARGDTPSPGPFVKPLDSTDLETKERFIFRGWPRDPKGKMITYSANFTGGKIAGKGGFTLWGATLYDFYRVSPFPSQPNYVWTTTGSRLVEWAKESGETEFAKDEIAWAEQEPEPKKRVPCDVLELAKDMDTRVRMGTYNGAQYPKPWPLTPFAYSAPLLQERIPYYILPEKLVVHDP